MKHKRKIKNGVRVLPLLYEKRYLKFVALGAAVSFTVGVALAFKAMWAASSDTVDFPLEDMVLLVLSLFFAGTFYCSGLALLISGTLIRILDTIIEDSGEVEESGGAILDSEPK
jgi:hypothetical protein